MNNNSENVIVETNYGLSLNEALAIQVEREPFILNGSHGFIEKNKNNENNQVRTMPTTNANLDNKVIKILEAGKKITPMAEINDWSAINVGGSRKVVALPLQIKDRLDPRDSIKDTINRFQFLNLRKPTGLTVKEINHVLSTKGVLKNLGKAFHEASTKHGINEMYLIVHARLETGNGISALSNGTYEVGLDKAKNPQLVTPSNRLSLTNIKQTFNMFGIGAVDTDPMSGGAKRAYHEEWFTPEAAILGGAAWIKNSYIYNRHNQNTLYKMRWNPNMKDGYAWKQYATDIDWALKQAKLIHDVYEQTDKNKSMTFDIPMYN